MGGNSPDEPQRVIMYSRAFCGYCSAARKLLESKDVPYEDIDVTLDAERRREAMARSGRNTLPQIFIGERHIGGYDDLAALEHDGLLDAMLQDGHRDHRNQEDEAP